MVQLAVMIFGDSISVSSHIVKQCWCLNSEQNVEGNYNHRNAPRTETLPHCCHVQQQYVCLMWWRRWQRKYTSARFLWTVNEYAISVLSLWLLRARTTRLGVIYLINLYREPQVEANCINSFCSKKGTRGSCSGKFYGKNTRTKWHTEAWCLDCSRRPWRWSLLWWCLRLGL
jgi:hypothetical protein